MLRISEFLVHAEPGALNLDLEQSRDQREVLNDLLWTLYSKFEAIAEGHRAVHDVIAGVVKREGLRHPQEANQRIQGDVEALPKRDAVLTYMTISQQTGISRTDLVVNKVRIPIFFNAHNAKRTSVSSS